MKPKQREVSVMTNCKKDQTATLSLEVFSQCESEVGYSHFAAYRDNLKSDPVQLSVKCFFDKLSIQDTSEEHILTS